MLDYEGELCFVFGEQCHNVDVDEAMEYVAGYTIANDVSARIGLARFLGLRKHSQLFMRGSAI